MFRKNVWESYSKKDLKSVFDFAKGYKNFISVGKTERLACKEAVKILEKNGFVNAETVTSIKVGDKVYFVNKNKNVAAFVIGEKPLKDGLRILGAHIDSPRIDFKENALYESDGFAMADTHYYGGIKKYQWTALPLALHGVVCKKDGTTVEIHIGEEDDDPVVGITDLLPHLAGSQMSKTGANIVEGEALDITLGSISTKEKDEEHDAIEYIKKILKDKYNIDNEDLVSSEIEVVPAGKAKDYGIDRSMIMGYGHDDRCCAYSSLMAILDIEKCSHTCCCILVDKEEIGSVGATGAHSLFFENIIGKLSILLKENHPVWNARLALENSKMLSSDVSAGYDPIYSYVFDRKNSAYLGHGIVLNKYTGARGKSGSNDSNPEYYAFIRNTFDGNNIYWQNAELGKVDQGGSGTIAYILGNYNMNVIDAGIPVLNMHAPWEVISKADLYEAYKAYIAFLKA